MSKRKFIPRKYQNLIIEHQLDKPRGNIWAGMGLGKTSATLCTLDIGYLCGIYESPTLVIATPRVAQSTWPDEVNLWDFRNVGTSAVVGTPEQRLKALHDKNANVFTISYENLPWLAETLGKKWPFKQVIADESTKLKSFRLKGGGRRAAAMRGIAFRYINMWQNLTGTPAPNGFLDLWGQNWFVDAGERLGRTFKAFESRWFDKIPLLNFYKTELRDYAQEQIQKALADVCITLDAKDWFDIKEPIVSNIYVNLPTRLAGQYRALEKEMFLSLQGYEIEAFNAASKTMKCLQFANGALYTDDNKNFIEIHDLKIQALESIVNESAGAPILVAYNFEHDKIRILKAFKQARLLDNNPETIRAWNRGEIPILVTHPRSAGHGLNLQHGGNRIVYFGHWWDLESAEQILERIGPTRQRQSGYDRPVFVYKIITRGTLDEDVVKCLSKKGNMQDALREAMKHKHKNIN